MVWLLSKLFYYLLSDQRFPNMGLDLKLVHGKVVKNADAQGQTNKQTDIFSRYCNIDMIYEHQTNMDWDFRHEIFMSDFCL